MSNPYASADQESSSARPAVSSGEIRGLQVITAALIMGVVSFAGVSLAIAGVDLEVQPELLAWMGIGFFFITYTAHLIAPRVVAGNAILEIASGSDEAEIHGRLMGVYRMQHIIGCALLEGAAFFNLVMYTTENFIGNLGVAALVVVLLTIKMPTATKIRYWIEDRKRGISTGT